MRPPARRRRRHVPRSTLAPVVGRHLTVSRVRHAHRDRPRRHPQLHHGRRQTMLPPGRSRGAPAEQRDQHLAGGERTVARPQPQLAGVGGVEESGRRERDQDDVAQPRRRPRPRAPRRASPPRRSAPWSAPRPCRRRAPWPSRPRRRPHPAATCSQRKRPSPLISVTPSMISRPEHLDRAAHLDLPVVGGHDEHRRRAAGPRARRRRAGRPPAARRRSTRPSPRRGRPCRSPRSRRRRRAPGAASRRTAVTRPAGVCQRCSSTCPRCAAVNPVGP